MSSALPFHGVRYTPNYDENGESLFHLKKSTSLKRRYGVWTMEVMVNEDGDYCPCMGERMGKDYCLCYRKRVPHVLYTCPHCGGINAVHTDKNRLRYGYNYSLVCVCCDRHLWVKFMDFEGDDWDRLVKKKGGAHDRAEGA